MNKRWFAILVMIAYASLSLYHMQLTTGQTILSIIRDGPSLNSVYGDYQDFLQNRTNISRGAQLIILLKAIIFPVALVLFCTFFTSSKLVVALFALPMIAFSVARGTDKETTDLLVMFGVLFIYYGMQRKLAAIALIAIPFAMYLFVARKYGRFDGLMPTCLPDSNTCFDFGSWLAAISPMFEIGWIMSVHYITQGYEGLNVAFGLSWEFNYGVGHLPPVRSVICTLTGALCEIQNFRSELAEVGWDTRYRWTTVYTILADDFHWLFTPVYIYFVGWSLRLAEIDWKNRQSGSGLAVIVLIAIFILYSSANMQIAVSLDWAFATIFLLYGKALTVRSSPRRLGMDKNV